MIHAMNRTRIRRIFLALLLCAPPILPARAQGEITCPPSLAVTTAATEIPGWQPVNLAAEELPLERIALRPARDSAITVPQTGFLRLEQGDRKTILASWDLTEIRRAHPELWLACFYTGTTIALLRQLPAEASACEYRVESGGDSLRESGGCR